MISYYEIIAYKMAENSAKKRLIWDNQYLNEVVESYKAAGYNVIIKHVTEELYSE